MPNPDWMLIFRSFTPEELAEHVSSLKSKITIIATQSVGDKSITRDLNELRGQLSAAIAVQNERVRPLGDHGYGVTDFSQIGT